MQLVNAVAVLLEGIFIKRPKNILEFEQLRKSLVSKRFDANCIVSVRAAEFHLIADKPAARTLDGENGGSRSDVKISVIPPAIRIALRSADK